MTADLIPDEIAPEALYLNTSELIPDVIIHKARHVGSRLARETYRKLVDGSVRIEEAIAAQRIVCIDTETSLIEKHSSRLTQLVCVSLHDSEADEEVALYKFDNTDWMLRFISAIEDTSCMVVAHNAAYDIPILLDTIRKQLVDTNLLEEDQFNELVLGVLQKAWKGKIVCTKVIGNIENIGSPRTRGFAPSLADLIKSKYGVSVVGKVGNTKPKASSDESNEDDTETDTDDEDVDEQVSRIMQRVSGEQEEDSWRLRYIELIDKPLVSWPKAAIDYAARDALYHRAAVDAYLIQQDKDGQTNRTWTVNVAADLAFALAGNFGVRTDLELVAKFKKETAKQIKEAAKKLFDMNLLSAHQKRDGTIKVTKKRVVLQNLVVELAKKQGIQYLTTKTGKPSTTESALMLVDSERNLLPWAEYSAAEKLRSTYIPVLVRGRLYPSYNVLVESFRSSCKDPNIQNLPRKGKSRECVVPERGHLFIGADFDVAELASLSEVQYRLFGHSVMGDKIKNGLDIHLWMASVLAGIDYDTAKARLKAGDKEIESLRQLSKALDFGYPGGLGPNNFIGFARGYGVDITLEQSQEYKRIWLSAFNDMPEYFKYINANVGGFGGRGNIRHPVTGAVRGGCTFTQAANFMFQHLTAIIAKDAWVRATAEGYDRRSPLYGFRSQLFIHDEIIGTIPMEAASDGAKRLAQLMHESAQRYSRDVPAKASPYVMDRWIKGAKAVYNDHGDLIPFRKEDKKQDPQPVTAYADVVDASLEELAA